MARAPGILWLGALSVRAPHCEISGKHATPYRHERAWTLPCSSIDQGLQFGLQFTPVRCSSREYVHAT